jgi:5-methylcytosine-specific restriction endonuclease McrA
VARDFSRAFYRSKAWEKTRNAYIKSVQYQCERCRRLGFCSPAEIVHHKVHLTPDNINDPYVTLSFDNLEALCRKCHAAEHPEIYGSGSPCRVEFDVNGDVVEPQ